MATLAVACTDGMPKALVQSVLALANLACSCGNMQEASAYMVALAGAISKSRLTRELSHA